MVLIEIDNSYSQIKHLTPSEFKLIRKELSYQSNPQATYFSGGFARTNYLIDKKGFFPSGLLHRVKTCLAKSNIAVSLRDKRIKPIPTAGMFKFQSKLKPHEDQLAMANIAMLRGYGGIQAATGSGKSLLIGLIASRLNVRTLVVVPTLEIKRQLTKSLIESLGRNSNIVVENIDSSRLDTLTDFDCLIIDEAHHVASRTYRRLNKTAWAGIYHRFFLTATFYRNDENEQLLFEGIAGQLIYKLTIKEAIAKKYIVPIEAYYYDVPVKKTEAYTWAQVYSELVVNNKPRNELIAKLLKRLNSVGKHTLCLVKEIAHGNILSGMTGASFANGQDDLYRDMIYLFNEGVAKTLIGTTGILGEGIDSRPAEFIVIAGLGKAKSAFLQQIGRGVRNYPGKESCKIILFRDKSHKFTLRHFSAQKKILLDELGIKPVRLNQL